MANQAYRVRHLREFYDDYDEALQANDPHGNHIQLDLRVSSWDSSLRVLATRDNLERVALIDDFMHEYRNPPERVTPFLIKLQQNPRLQTVECNYLQFSGDSMASFLDTATSITTLELNHCRMIAPGGALAVAAALQRNSNILRLKLCDIHQRCLVPIVSSLAYNTSVKELELWYGDMANDPPVARLLESTKTIQTFEFRGSNNDLEGFGPISQALIQSTSVTAVKFTHCHFTGQNKVLLNSILTSKSNLQSLAFYNCSVDEDGQTELRAAILSLLQPHSLLRSLDLGGAHHWRFENGGFSWDQNFPRLLAAVERSPLERFSVGLISGYILMALITSIPKMQVLTLELRLRRFLQNRKEDIIQAIKRNASLRTVVVKAENGIDDWFDDNDKMILRSYSVRNHLLAQFENSMVAPPRAAWPEYLAVAGTTGPDTVFRILEALAPSLGPTEPEPFVGGQCRRPRKRCRLRFDLSS
jgi:hypothetical protein